MRNSAPKRIPRRANGPSARGRTLFHHHFRGRRPLGRHSVSRLILDRRQPDAEPVGPRFLDHHLRDR
ncbi:hypothetical protein, partial [Paractinoplanes deccanensis]|uniref:hypothetical protein n=1 Tax=Paractinoplanes deccanensis TaxID=113561 RepID=UPI0019442E43